MKKFKAISSGLAGLVIVLGMLGSCKKDSGSGGNSMPDPNGTWEVKLVNGGHCLAPAASKLITVSGDQFNATIVTFGTHPLSIQGTITKGNINYVVSGNETISGSGCVGTNGFFSYIEPFQTPIVGTASSNWGTLRFEKK